MRKSRRLAYESSASPAVAQPPQQTYQLHDVARLAAANDNAFIATRSLPAGAALLWDGDGPPITLSHEVLEGHRFARELISPGELLTSWHHPFGKALCPIAPGEWLRNAKTIHELSTRRVGAASLPSHANFADLALVAHVFSEESFEPGRSRAMGWVGYGGAPNAPVAVPCLTRRAARPRLLPLAPDTVDLAFAGFERRAPRRCGSRAQQGWLPRTRHDSRSPLPRRRALVGAGAWARVTTSC
jgi:hypothetical protein